MSAPFKKIKSNNMSESKTSSWVEYGPDSEFPIQNLPWGAFQIPSGETHVGVAIGNKVLDVTALANEGLFNDSKHLQGGDVFKQSTLNAFMGLGRAAWTEARSLLSLWLSADNGTIRDNASLLSLSLLSQSDVKMVLPAQIGDYTDFYASRYHATNVGIMFRGKDNALQPNWLHLPVGYHGRASSVVVSGTDMKRPNGQLRPDLEKPPVFGSCKLLDFELEMGYFVGPSNDMGTPISIENASDHIFGVVLMNDWSARDIQKWEYVPLGPFNGKNFGTTISPWIVTLDALAPFTTEAEEQVPEVLPYLSSPSRAMFDISLSVSIQAEGESDESVVSTSNAKYLYWTPQQMLTHHTSTGCPMRPGDLFGSGTISGPEEHEYGSMLELCWKGTREVELKNGGKRKFLKDGDTVKMRGFCQGEGYRVGFGSCDGKVIPANKLE